MDSFYNCWFSVVAVLSVLQREDYNAIGFPTTIARSFAACTNPKNEADPEIPKRLPSLQWLKNANKNKEKSNKDQKARRVGVQVRGGGWVRINLFMIIILRV